ncbi:MAG: hypothetical protein JXA13_11375 [Anaerolineales bacterium]|nr:hypothetical protein [Anaerolineales bacterium]
MDNRMLLGLCRCVLSIPPQIWLRVVRPDANLDFMDPDSHRVRNLVVREMPGQGKALTPEWISCKLGLGRERVVEILDELERNMTFLFRSPQGAVTWANPVTVDKTPHHVTFSTGEQVYAA